MFVMVIVCLYVMLRELFSIDIKRERDYYSLLIIIIKSFLRTCSEIASFDQLMQSLVLWPYLFIGIKNNSV